MTKVGKCFSVETGTLTFAVINCFAVGVSSITSFAWVMYRAWKIFTNGRDYYYRSEDFITIAVEIMVKTLLYIAFAFSIVLVHGVIKQKPNFIKAYFIYGIIMLVLFFETSMVFLMWWFMDVDYAFKFDLMGFAMFGLCLVYGAVLTLIWKSYKKLE